MTNYKNILTLAIRKPATTRGFTLLETTVALSVILAALVGPISLITRGIFDFSFAKNKIIAANLTQEGIELVRAIRENNVICDVINGPAVWQWNRDPDGGLITATTREVAARSNTSITCGPFNIATPRLPLYTGQKIKFDPATGIYGNIGDDTIFIRRIEIRLPPDSPDAGIPPSSQMDVISNVEWNERGLPRNLVLRERMYNWK